MDKELNHYPECQQQPEAFPCICDHVSDRLFDERMDREIENKLEENNDLLTE